MKRQCKVCQRYYDPAKVRSGVPQGICTRACAIDARRLRASDRASRRTVPPRTPTRLHSVSSRDWSEGRAKVDAEGACRVCPPGVLCGKLEAAHVIPRSLAPNGGEDARGIVPLGAPHHRLYDAGELDLLPYLSVEEQAYAVELAGGLVAALRVITGQRSAA